MKDKLPRAFKKNWVAALRSGKYKQGYGKLLNYAGEYCCLGVAAEICGLKNIRGKPVIVKGRYIKGIDKMHTLLIGTPSTNTVVEKLTDMNDGTIVLKKKSFKQIANYIEKNL